MSPGLAQFIIIDKFTYNYSKGTGVDSFTIPQIMRFWRKREGKAQDLE